MPKWIGFVFLVASAGVPGAASAQNLVTNPDFDDDLDGWGGAIETFSYSTLDANQDPNSGSAQANAVNSDAFAIISFLGPGTYDVGGRIRFGTGEGSAWLMVEWRSQGCLDFLQNDSTPLVSIQNGGRWIPSYSRLVAPFGAECADLYLISSDGLDTRFDGVIFASAGTVPLPLFVDRFESGNMDEWSGKVVGP